MPANLQPLTGVDGALALLNGTPTTTTAEAFSQITQMPGGNMAFPAKQIFQATARTKKVMDPRVPPIIYNSGVAVPSTQYILFYGAGIVFFRTPLGGTPVITADFTYIPTVTATDVVTLDNTNNVNLTMTGNQIQGDKYGTLMIPEYRGKLQGTFQFDYLSSSTNIDLWNLMQIQNFFMFAAYESVQQNRIRILYGDLTGMPINVPGNAMVGGTITATQKYPFTFLYEAL